MEALQSAPLPTEQETTNRAFHRTVSAEPQDVSRLSVSGPPSFVAADEEQEGAIGANKNDTSPSSPASPDRIALTPSPDSPSKPRSSTAEVPAELRETFQSMLNEQRAQLKEEILEQLRRNGSDGGLDSQSNLTGSFSYPSSPPSVVASVSSKISTHSSVSQRVSPNLANVTAAPPPSTRASTTSGSPPVSPPQKPTVRFSDKSKPIIHGGRSDGTPTPPFRSPYGVIELSPIDKKWGVLFDPRTGFTTTRLGQVLRGLANYINTEYHPTRTLVITPEKMALLYATYPVDTDICKFHEIFKASSRGALERLEHLYLDLECEYHLVQSDTKMSPDIPGLTPSGFTKWLTASILAYPDIEAARLSAIVMDLPIDADGSLVDGKPERLPTQLPRHLLPAAHDERSRKYFDTAIRDFYRLIIPSSPRGPAPPSTQSRSRAVSFDKRNDESGPRSKRLDDNRRRSTAMIPERPADERRRERRPYRPRDSEGGRAYDRSGPRTEPGRETRTNAERGSWSSGAQGLPPPPIGGSSVLQRARTPPPTNRWASSMPANIQSLAGSSAHSPPSPGPSSSALFTPSSSYNSTADHFELSAGRSGRRESDNELGKHPPRSPRGSAAEDVTRPMASVIDLRQPHGATDRSASQRSLAIADERGPTWDDFLRGSSTSTNPFYNGI